MTSNAAKTDMRLLGRPLDGDEWTIRFTPLIAAIFAIPLSFGAYKGMEFSAAYILSPLIVYLILRNLKDRLTLLFIATGIAGLTSIAVINVVAPGDIKANVAELAIWTLFAPSFIFVGRSVDIRSMSFWLAVFFSFFLIVATAPILFQGEPFRAISERDSKASLNLTFFGLPVFATYGVNSLAPLFSLSTAVLIGAAHSTGRVWLPLFGAGLMCSLLIAIGSESRMTLASLALMVSALWFYTFRYKPDWRVSAVIFASVFISVGITVIRAQEAMRFVKTVEDVVAIASEDAPEPKPTPEAVTSAPQLAVPATPKPVTPQVDADTITTGRVMVWKAAFDEWLASPLFGIGFGTFGRLDPSPLPPAVKANTTAHNFELNALWKGGLVFAIPFAAFVLLAFWRAWIQRTQEPTWYFAAWGVIMLFATAQTWDILMIPSAGALTWLLLGSLGRRTA